MHLKTRLDTIERPATGTLQVNFLDDPIAHSKTQQWHPHTVKGGYYEFTLLIFSRVLSGFGINNFG